MNNYRFNNEINPETGKSKHFHEILVDGEWKQLTGTSTIVSKTIPKPLTWWASGLAVSTLGWTKSTDWKLLKTQEAKDNDLERRIKTLEPVFETIKEMSAPDFLKLLDKAYRAHDDSLDKSAQKGTDLHAELERYVKNTMENRMATYDDKIKPFIEWSIQNVDKFLVSEGHCYSKELFVGGITDCIALLKNGEIAIIDFKSSKEAYKSHYIQIGGYAIEIEENGVIDSKGNTVLKLEKPVTQFIVIPFGSPRPAPVAMRGVDVFKKGFRDAVSLYRLLENYNE
jgi:hypothetical protein